MSIFEWFESDISIHLITRKGIIADFENLVEEWISP
jgi:hypothetical protein